MSRRYYHRNGVLTLECAACGRFLSADAFPVNRRMQHGRHSWCSACKVERNRQWRAEHPENVAAYNVARRYPVPACARCGGPSDKPPGPGRYNLWCRACREAVAP